MPPPVQMVPSTPEVRWTRPERLSAVPCRAWYGVVSRPLLVSQPARAAWRLPVMGVLDGAARDRKEGANLNCLGGTGWVQANDAAV